MYARTMFALPSPLRAQHIGPVAATAAARLAPSLPLPDMLLNGMGSGSCNCVSGTVQLCNFIQLACLTVITAAERITESQSQRGKVHVVYRLRAATVLVVSCAAARCVQLKGRTAQQIKPGHSAQHRIQPPNAR